MQSLSMLGVLIAGIGAFMTVASWDSGRTVRTRKTRLFAYTLIGAGIALFVAGILVG